ncbi:MAG: phosphatidylglycerophosphatase A [Methylophilaceae bacterium]|nr:phosphatidylglycerophosphatase A [Methylophilaceae bacterium]
MTTLSNNSAASWPDWKFLLKRPAHFFALGFGAGLSKVAPGTFGTLVALPLFAILMQAPELVHYTTILVLFVLGIRLCEVTGKNLGVSDHGSIVWDEIVAMLLVLEFTPLAWQWWVVAFLLFRLFDIWKPFPIRQCDAKLKGGFGVMFDDLLAAIYAIIALKALQWLMTSY